ncbi:MAG: hypothetical protein FJ215_03165 [Ignavibacteria bacterium]|nr:hypothetical protein [Ignavibacteria bacterium]
MHKIVVRACVVLFISSCTSIADHAEPLFDIRVINSSEAPQFIDYERTYEYNFSSVNPESVLTVLWKNGFKISQAWLPIDYRCKDMIGARLTVELVKPDERMKSFDFRNGTGRLSCASQLMWYRILN